jgi:hypothetical protein
VHAGIRVVDIGSMEKRAEGTKCYIFVRGRNSSYISGVSKLL